MALSHIATAAVLGVSLLIIIQIFSGSLIPTTSDINATYEKMKDRAVDQRQAGINITNISDVGWWNANWQYRKLIRINHSQVESDLTNFPVLIDTTDDDLKNKAQSNGYDIAFVSGDNTVQYNHEIENFSGSRLVAWVNVTKVYKDVDTWFFMYYGYPGVPSDQANPEDVWDSNDAMVQHLEETSGTLYDSTNNNNDGTNVNGAVYTTAGKIDGAYDFASAFSRYITVSKLNNGKNYESGEFTVSLWFKTPIQLLSNKCLISDYCKGAAAIDCYGWHLSIDNLGLLSYTVGTTTGTSSIRGTTFVSTGTWHHVVVVDRGETSVTGKNTIIYLDGNVEVDASRGTKKTNANRKFLISALRTDTYTDFFTGTTDEVVLSDIGRDSSWITTSYNTMSSPSTFINVEPEQTQSFTYLNITVNNTGSTTLNIDEFTLLVNGTKLTYVYLQPYHYPLKETTLLVNVTAAGTTRNKLIAGTGKADYKEYSYT